MPRCSHTYADSSQCRRIVSAEQRYCYSHDPGRAGGAGETPLVGARPWRVGSWGG